MMNLDPRDVPMNIHAWEEVSGFQPSSYIFNRALTTLPKPAPPSDNTYASLLLLEQRTDVLRSEGDTYPFTNSI